MSVQLEMAAGGSTPDQADRTLQIMQDHPLGRQAASISKVTEGPPGKVELWTKIHTTRLIEPPLGEQLPKIC